MARDGSFSMVSVSPYRHIKGRNLSLFLPMGADGSRGGGGEGTPSKRENGGATRGRRDRYLINERKKDPAEVGQVLVVSWWPLAELNCGHEDFQSSALPSELKGHALGRGNSSGYRAKVSSVDPDDERPAHPVVEPLLSLVECGQDVAGIQGEHAEEGSQPSEKCLAVVQG